MKRSRAVGFSYNSNKCPVMSIGLDVLFFKTRIIYENRKKISFIDIIKTIDYTIKR